LVAIRLAHHLRKVGFACEIIEVPSFRLLEPRIRDELVLRRRMLAEILYVLDMLLSYALVRYTSLDAYDLVVTLQPICLYLKHPKMLIYFLHHHRSAYDLYQYLAADLHGFERLGFRVAMWLRRILDLGAVAYIKKRHLRLIAISNTVARRLAVFWGMRPARVLYPGGYAPAFHNLPGEYVLYLGRFQWVEKRLWMIYEAARQLPSFKFVLAGSGAAPLKRKPPNLEVIAVDRLFTEREKADLYARASCILFPARDEDFGLVPVEAMSAGKPCLVCTDGGGATETVINGKTGLVVGPTVGDVVDGIRTLTKKSESMKEDCVRRAKLFSWEHFLTEMENEIRGLLNERAPRT
jgi:glycosyltransferase involved in cell wall biosynthesis